MLHDTHHQWQAPWHDGLRVRHAACVRLPELPRVDSATRPHHVSGPRYRLRETRGHAWSQGLRARDPCQATKRTHQSSVSLNAEQECKLSAAAPPNGYVLPAVLSLKIRRAMRGSLGLLHVAHVLRSVAWLKGCHCHAKPKESLGVQHFSTNAAAFDSATLALWDWLSLSWRMSSFSCVCCARRISQPMERVC